MPTLDNRLEDLLLQKYRSMRYADAKKLVSDCRQTLKMSRIEPWTEQLLAECERQWTGQVVVLQIADTDEVALRMAAATADMERTSRISLVSHEKEEVERASSSTLRDLACSPEKLDSNEQPIVDGTSTTEPMEDSEGSSSFEGTKEIKQHIVEESNSSGDEHHEQAKLTELIINSNKGENGQDPPAACHDKDEDDEDDDDEEDDDDDDDEDSQHSQESDHSQCFTTAEEAGISKAAIAAAIAEAEKAEADDLEFAALHNVLLPAPVPPEQDIAKKSKNVITTGIMAKDTMVLQNHSKRPPTTKPLGKKIHFIEDHVTIATSENSELGGIPTVIYVRRDGKCEVPEDEPLGESYNIPLPVLLAATAKKSRVRKLRQTFARRLQRWGLVRGSRDPKSAPRLDENDPEAHFQTLVDL
jgi:hypothetical protein